MWPSTGSWAFKWHADSFLYVFVACSFIAKGSLRFFLVPVAFTLAPSVAGVLHLLLHPTLALSLLCALLALAFLYRAFLQVRLYAFAAISTASHCDLILDIETGFELSLKMMCEQVLRFVLKLVLKFVMKILVQFVTSADTWFPKVLHQISTTCLLKNQVLLRHSVWQRKRDMDLR